MACGAESSQYEFRYIEEITAGTIPTGDMQIMRNTGGSGGVTKSGVTSEEIRSDRQIVDWVMTKKEPAVEKTGEFSYDTWDDFLEAALFSDWLNTRFRSADIEVTGANTYELPTGHGIALTAGQLINVQGFTTAANNGLKEVVSLIGDILTVIETLTVEAAGDAVSIRVMGEVFDTSGNNITVTNADSTYTFASAHGLTLQIGQSIGWVGFVQAGNNGTKTVASFTTTTIVVEETLADETIITGDVLAKYDTLVNGVAEHTFTVEDDFTDVVKTRTMTGMTVNTLALSMPNEAIVGVTLNLIGRNTTVQDNSLVTGTPIEPNSNDVMNSGDNVASITEGGVAVALATEITLEIANNLRGNTSIGDIENTCVASGNIGITGNLNVYFEDWTTYQKFLDNSASSLRFALTDSNGAYHFNIPRIKFPTLDVNAGGPNQDVIATGTYQGLRDPTTGKTIIITRIDA